MTPKWASQVAVGVKNMPANAGDIRDVGLIPGSGRSPEEGIATHSSILAWRLPWTEELGRLHRVANSWKQLRLLSTHACTSVIPK